MNEHQGQGSGTHSSCTIQVTRRSPPFAYGNGLNTI